MEKFFINPPSFSKTIGSYSHGIKVMVGDKYLIFVTGQIAMDSSGNPVAPDNIEKQTHYIFENIKRILHEACSTLDDVVKAQIFITNMDNFHKVSAIRNKYFEKAKPVSTLVEISKTAKVGCDIEIEVIAISE